MAKKVYTRQIEQRMAASGRPVYGCGQKYANVYRALLAAGLDTRQASAVTLQAYDAAQGYTWLLPTGSAVHLATQARNATLHPYGKDAEDKKAAEEGRSSRWGTPEFHGEHQH